MRHKVAKTLGLLTPAIVMTLWIVYLGIAAGSDQRVSLRIEGFDPRDLLSGHYLTYRVDYGGTPDCRRPGPWCLCLDAADSGHATLSAQGPCASLKQCTNLLRGLCKDAQFSAGIERFYFSENFQKELRVVPANSSIEVALSKGGESVVINLFVDSIPLNEWLATEAAKRAAEGL